MARNPNQDLKISYKVSNNTLQLKISFGYIVEPEVFLESFDLDEKGNPINQKYARKIYPVVYAPFYIATGITGLKPNQWDAKNKKLTGDASYLQTKLDTLVERIHSLYKILKATQGIESVTPEAFKNLINSNVKAKNVEIPNIDTSGDLATDGKLYVINNKIIKSRFSYMPLVNYFSFRIKNWSKGQKSPGTINGYYGLLKWLNAYCSKHGIIRIKDFNDEFLLGFFNYVKSQGDFKINYLNKLFKQLRMLYNCIVNEEKYQLNINWRSDYLPRTTEISDEVALDFEQLLKVYRLVVPDNKPGYARIKDLFVFGCLTGLRYRDLSSINIEESRWKLWVRQTMEKVRDSVKIPLHPIAKEIYDKYNGELPVVNRQKFSDVIKELCKEAGLTQPVTRYRTDSRTKALLKETVQFADLVKSSSCRRTFATLSVYEWSIPPTIAKKYTGHAKLTTFLTYIRANDEHVEDLLAEKFSELQGGYIK